MRIHFLATVALVGLVSVAEAQEAGYDWSGFYIGAHAGYAQSSSDFDADATDFAGKRDSDGFVGGVYVGHDWQNQNLVYGFVADFDGLSTDGFAFGDEEALTGGKGEAYSYDIDWVATARARIGFTATDRLLVYGTGGIAAARFQATNYYDSWLDEPTESKFDGVKIGGVFGAGVEYGFAENWSAKTEFLHHTFNAIKPGPGGSSGASFRPELTTVKFGLAYRF
ncbi:MAG TPA: outer membrane protein [Rhizobiaceae bacterium]